MSNKINTRDHNLDILQNLGYRKVSNTTVFKNGDNFILSPAVAKSRNGKYWFDIREVNLNRINSKSILLVRIVPDLFILETLKNISLLLSKEVMEHRPNSGNVWSIHINIKKYTNSAFLYNIKNQDNKIATKLINKSSINDVFNVIKENI